MAAIPAPSKLKRIGLFGSPNSGKTSLFNALTGGREKVANYAGVTVERISGTVSLQGGKVELVDVPGLYSLRALSADEVVARQALTGEEKPDRLIFVLDAVNLERSLFLLSQTAELGIPIVVALTMADVVRKEREGFDALQLQQLLGLPVIEVLSHKKIGLDALMRAVERHDESPQFALGFPEKIEQAVTRLLQFPNRPVDFGPWHVREALLADGLGQNAENPAWAAALDAERQALLGENIQPRTLDAQIRYAWAGRIARKVQQAPLSDSQNTWTQRADRILTHKFWGVGLFLALMYGVFLSIYAFASPLMDLIESGIGALQGLVSPMLQSSPVLQSLVVDGIIGGVGAALVFLPQIAILFFLISILEGSGYLARASFLMDRALGWCGLSGRAFIPLLSSFACAIPGVMAARVMPDNRSRIQVIMIAPLMSCSARLPVYVLFIGAFVEPVAGPFWAGFALLLMHFIGLIYAIPVALIMDRRLLGGLRLPMMMELPRYQAPKWRDIIIMVWNRVTVFLKTAGTTIVVMSLLIWATLYFPTGEGREPVWKADYAAQSAEFRERIDEPHYFQMRQNSESYLGQTGKFIEPIFLPAGFDWRLSTAILAAFPAREVVVSAMGILFGQGAEAADDDTSLRKSLAEATWPDGRPLMSLWNAFGLMVFFALCCQCMATLAAIRRETGSWKLPIIAFSYMTALAYVSAVIIYQIGRAVGGA